MHINNQIKFKALSIINVNIYKFSVVKKKKLKDFFFYF